MSLLQNDSYDVESLTRGCLFLSSKGVTQSGIAAGWGIAHHDGLSAWTIPPRRRGCESETPVRRRQVPISAGRVDICRSLRWGAVSLSCPARLSPFAGNSVQRPRSPDPYHGDAEVSAEPTGGLPLLWPLPAREASLRTRSILANRESRFKAGGVCGAAVLRDSSQVSPGSTCLASASTSCRVHGFNGR